MRNLLKLFLKYYAVFLFILLEFAALFLVFQHNHYQNAIFLNSSSGLVGFVNQKVSNVTDYLSLKEENERLQNENLRLQRMLENQLSKSPAQVDKFIDAEVVNNSVIRKKNYITIDRGENFGVQKQMGVMGPDGVVGIVENTSAHFASVIPVINLNFKLSAELSKNNYYGSLGWDGKDIRIAHLNEIPNYVNVQKGDTVVTSGFSSSFDQGRMIGTVYSAEKSSASAFWTIRVKLATDYRNVNKVYLVDKASLKEQSTLEAEHD